MNDQEVELISHKINLFSNKKSEIVNHLVVIRNDISIYNTEGESIINTIIDKLRGINHYEEILILEYLDEMINLINFFEKPFNNPNKINVIYYLNEMCGFVERFILTKENFQTYTANILTNSILEVNEELSSFKRLRNIADNAKTENIYNNAVLKYKKLEDDYREYFYWAIGILITISICLFLAKNSLVETYFTNIEFWVFKVSILAVGITLISYFIKQSSHYQRLADQNYQTQVELQAYPSFMESIPSNEAASVRKELALKYFGREIDSAAHKDMGNLISDQMKSTTDMVKATTEAIKNLKE